MVGDLAGPPLPQPPPELEALVGRLQPRPSAYERRLQRTFDTKPRLTDPTRLPHTVRLG